MNKTVKLISTFFLVGAMSSFEAFAFESSDEDNETRSECLNKQKNIEGFKVDKGLLHSNRGESSLKDLCDDLESFSNNKAILSLSIKTPIHSDVSKVYFSNQSDFEILAISINQLYEKIPSIQLVFNKSIFSKEDFDKKMEKNGVSEEILKCITVNQFKGISSFGK